MFQCFLASYQHRGDGSRWQLRLRAVAHIIHYQDSVWPEVRQHLLDQLNSEPTGCLRDFSVTSGAEISLQSLQTSLMHFVWTIWDRNKGFDSDKNAQLTADAHHIIVVMITYDYSNIKIRAPSSLQSAEAIRAAIPTARLLDLVYSSCSGIGHWGSIDTEGARELLGKREYAGVCVSRVRQMWAVAHDRTGARTRACATHASDYGVIASF